MNTITWGLWYWPRFLIITSSWITLAFGIPEITAIFTETRSHADNTLSRYAWHELNVSPAITIHTAAWWATLLTWAVFVFVITLHIWFDQPA